MAGELPLIAVGIAAAVGANSIPDRKVATAVRWGGIAVAAVAAWRLISSKGSLLGGVVGELVPQPAKPGAVVDGQVIDLPATTITPTNPELTAASPGELLVTPKQPTHVYARIVEPPPDGEVAIDLIGKTYSVVLEVTNPTSGALPSSRIEIETQEHDSGLTSLDTSAKPAIARTFIDIPALDSGSAWRGEVKIKLADKAFLLRRQVFAKLTVDGQFSSATYFYIAPWVTGWL
jgi:hypothetical protein